MTKTTNVTVTSYKLYYYSLSIDSGTKYKYYVGDQQPHPTQEMDPSGSKVEFYRWDELGNDGMRGWNSALCDCCGDRCEDCGTCKYPESLRR